MSSDSENFSFDGKIGVLFGLSFFLFFSHISGYLADNMLCDAPPRTMSFRCLAGGLGVLVFGLCSIPASIVFSIVAIIVGTDSYFGNMVFFGILSGLLGAYYFRDGLLERGTIAASFTVSQPDPRPSLDALKRQAKTMEKELDRQDARTEMEDAIREMEEAKARLDELKKNQSS